MLIPVLSILNLGHLWGFNKNIEHLIENISIKVTRKIEAEDTELGVINHMALVSETRA